MTAADDGAQKKGRVTGENSRAAWLIYFGWCASSTVERQRGRTDSRGTERRRGGGCNGRRRGRKNGNSFDGRFAEQRSHYIFSKRRAGLNQGGSRAESARNPISFTFRPFLPAVLSRPPSSSPPPITAPPSARLPRGLIVWPNNRNF